MTNVTLNRKVVESLIGKKLTTDELKHAITYLGTDLDEVTDEEIIVEIFPNRPDLLSDEGMGRALCAFVGNKPGLRRYRAKSDEYAITVNASKKTIDPYATGAVVTGLKLDDDKLRSIIQVQEKMHVSFARNRARMSIGVYPLEHITFPLTFTTKKIRDVRFVPLGFTREMTGDQILHEHPTGKDYGYLLNGADEANFWFDAKGKVLAFAPLTNAEDVGRVTVETSNIFIDVSGTDLHSCEQALTMLCCMFSDMGGQLHRCNVTVDEKTIVVPSLSTPELPVDVSYVNALLGTGLSEKEMGPLLSRMGMEYNKGIVTVPCYRTDILHPCDIVEDIAISYGYDNIEPLVPELATEAREDGLSIFRRTILSVLVGYGFIEAKSYHLTSAEKDAQCCKEKPITLLHSVSSGYDVLRQHLLGNLLEVLSKNAHHTYPHMICESGVVFGRDEKSETGISEVNHLAGAIAGEDVDYTRLRQAVDGIGRSLGLMFSYKTSEKSHYIPGRSAAICYDKIKIGEIGELHPATLTFFHLSVPTVAFELDLEELYKIGRRVRE